MCHMSLASLTGAADMAGASDLHSCNICTSDVQIVDVQRAIEIIRPRPRSEYIHV